MIAYAPEPYEAETLEYLHVTRAIFEDLVGLIPNERAGDLKTTLLAVFESLALEHFHGIILLVESRMAIGTAFTLFRPLLETIARGEWLYLFGEESDRHKFAKNNFRFKGLRTLANEIDTKLNLGERLANYTRFYAHLCDFTHSGVLAAGLRLSPVGSVEPSYKEDSIRLLVTNVTSLTVLHFAVMARFHGDEDLANRISQLTLRLKH